MSRLSSLKQKYHFCKFVRENLGCSRTYRHQPLYNAESIHGKLTITDNLTKVIDLQALWICIMRDLGLGSSNCDGKSFRRILKCMNQLDVYEWLVCLDKFDDLLLSGTKDESFKKLRRREWETLLVSQGCDPEFTNCVSALVLPELRKWYNELNVDAFRKLHEVFTFSKRLSLQNEFLADVALDGWKDSESLPVYIYDDDKIVQDMNAILQEWFPKAEAEHVYQTYFYPSHGPGAVMEGCKTLAEKYLCLGLNSMQREFMRKYKLEGNCGFPSKLMQRVLRTRRLLGIAAKRNTTCKAVFVNKSWKTYRTISMESTTNMWLQQGLFACLKAWIRIRPHGLSDYYTLDSDTTNKWLALEGSYDGKYATVDLHAASDLISWSLVSALFKNTWLEDALYAFRSTYCVVEQDNNSCYEQRKFAPMGAADCFPVLTIVSSVACEWVCRFKLGKPMYLACKNDWPLAACYGDDIAIDSRLVPLLQKVLTHIGLKVNMEKSYYNREGMAYFRESCGGEYINGVDVTPLRISRKFPGITNISRKGISNNAESIAGLIEFCNSLNRYGFSTARALVVDHLLNELKLSIPFTKDGSLGLLHEDPHNQHLHRKYDADRQKWLYKVHAVVASQPKTACFEENKPSLRYLRKTTGLPEWQRLEHFSREDGEFRYAYLTADGWVDDVRLYEWLRRNPKRSVDRYDRVVPLYWPDQRTLIQMREYKQTISLKLRLVDLEFPDA